MEISSFYAVIATARPGASLPEVEKIVSAEIGRLAREGPNAAELRGRRRNGNSIS